jgi:hypothetical protein
MDGTTIPELKELRKEKMMKLDYSEEKYISYVHLMDKDTKEIFSNKLNIVILELPRFTKTDNNLQSGIDHWMFILNNMPKLAELPEIFRGNAVFEQMFENAKYAKMSKEERKNYNNSLKIYRDMNIMQQEAAAHRQERAMFQQERASFQQREAAYQQREAAKNRVIAELCNRLGVNVEQVIQ